MAERSDTGEIVKRALAYPYASPAGSFVFVGGEARALPEEADRRIPGAAAAVDLDLAGRTPLLAYGANAAPEALARKLAADSPLPVLRAELEDFDIVYSAHVSPYGAVPATLHPSPGTGVAVHVLYPDGDQLPLLAATEPNYELTQLRGVACRVGGGAEEGDWGSDPTKFTLASLGAFLSRHGRLTVGGAPLALRAIPAHNRRLASLEEPDVLELVRSQLAPDGTLAHFITACVELGGVAPLPTL